MEATASFSSPMASHHFFPLCKATLPNSKLNPICNSSSSWIGSTQSLSFSSRNSFTRDTWRMINSKNVVTIRREMRGFIRAEMFGQLTSGLETAWNKLKGEDGNIDPFKEVPEEYNGLYFKSRNQEDA